MADGQRLGTGIEKELHLMKKDRFGPKAVRMLSRSAVVLLLGLGAAQAQDFNLAAKVNDAEITRARVQSGVDAMMRDGQMNYGGITQPKQMKRMQKQILDQLIAQELLWQEARRAGFVATPEEVDQTLEQMLSRYGTEAAYRQDLERNGFTVDSHREDLKRHISARRWVQEPLAKDIGVSDAEIHDYYTANPSQFRQPEQVNARHVLIEVAPGADEATIAAARQRMAEILAEAKQGADFAELAKTHSEGPSAPRGGDLGFVSPGQLVKPFEDAAFALEPGEISAIVRTRYGFHIIKLEARREGHLAPEAQAAPALRNYLASIKLQEAVEDRVRSLRAQGSIEILIPL
jgi:parvulin-like peptidyl-prolyl isomerase